jgi:hypothetical protein
MAVFLIKKAHSNFQAVQISTMSNKLLLHTGRLSYQSKLAFFGEKQATILN